MLTNCALLIFSSTMEDIVDVESELTQRLSGLQKRLEKVAHPDLSHRGDLGKVHELIKANLQRSKVIQDQVNESKVYYLCILPKSPLKF